MTAKKTNSDRPIKQILLIMIITISIFSYIIWDILVVKPEFNRKLDDVNEKFNKLSIYLDQKLPKIDSVLTAHELQVKEFKLSENL